MFILSKVASCSIRICCYVSLELKFKINLSSFLILYVIYSIMIMTV